MFRTITTLTDDLTISNTGIRRISTLPSVDLPYNGSEYLIVKQDDETKSGSFDSIATYLSGQILEATSDWENTYTTVAANSSFWTDTYSVVSSSSASWSFTGVDGSGTANSLAKWSDLDTITDSIITDDSSTVTIDGNLSIQGNLTAHGDMTYIDTTVTTTSAMSITNAGTGPALRVEQSGNEPIAHFIDSEGGDIVFNNDGYIGVGTSTPNERLTVSGNISATGGLSVDGELSGSHIQNLGSADSPTFRGFIADDGQYSYIRGSSAFGILYVGANGVTNTWGGQIQFGASTTLGAGIGITLEGNRQGDFIVWNGTRSTTKRLHLTPSGEFDIYGTTSNNARLSLSCDTSGDATIDVASDSGSGTGDLTINAAGIVADCSFLTSGGSGLIYSESSEIRLNCGGGGAATRTFLIAPRTRLAGLAGGGLAVQNNSALPGDLTCAALTASGTVNVVGDSATDSRLELSCDSFGDATIDVASDSGSGTGDLTINSASFQVSGPASAKSFSTTAGSLSVNGGNISIADSNNYRIIFGTALDLGTYWAKGCRFASGLGLCWSSAGALAYNSPVDVGLFRLSAGWLEVRELTGSPMALVGLGSLQLANLTASGTVKTGTYTVATLPAAATAGAGARAFVTDSDVDAAGNFGATVTASVPPATAYAVPVYSDGSVWRIG